MSSTAQTSFTKLRGLTFRRMRNAAVKWSLSPCARSVMGRRLTYLSPQKLRVLERHIKRVDRQRVPGDFVECGVALGGSAILLSSFLSPDRNFHGYDVFEMIPPPGPKDESDAHDRYKVIQTGASRGIAGEAYYGYMTKLRDVVIENFRKAGLTVDDQRINLHRGLFEDTLHFAPGAQVALAHIDCDWHDPVLLCLERIYAHLAVGGCMILDDYNDYRGCRTATDSFLKDKPDLRLIATAPNAVVMRVAAH